VYVPAGGDFFCVEPQTAATGALNRAEDEVELVQPGRRFAIDVSLSPGGP
jgi:galactose mutarotase-like enzyme